MEEACCCLVSRMQLPVVRTIYVRLMAHGYVTWHTGWVLGGPPIGTAHAHGGPRSRSTAIGGPPRTEVQVRRREARLRAGQCVPMQERGLLLVLLTVRGRRGLGRRADRGEMRRGGHLRLRRRPIRCGHVRQGGRRDLPAGADGHDRRPDERHQLVSASARRTHACRSTRRTARPIR